ncbi:XdhC family protein [Parendozoicomonas sp. Alg238-R29]|uniref:XdhC family protein n=1 Tax=Parendozoicomonas sp. Alg238-R29 TaxID=2993446 RepID=UPI00248EF908|nr:XdhC family protein [Parendozoicomonas sp. Alg238-R29]
MHSSNCRVIEQVCQWLDEEEHVWLASIVATWGSSPRPAGSLLAYSPGKGIAGSLSGGCVEEDLLRQLANNNIETTPSIHSYGLTKNDQLKLALPCGGNLSILLERLEKEFHLPHFREIEATLQQGQLISRQVCTQTGALALQSGSTPSIDQNQTSINHTLGPAFKLLLTGAGETTRCVAELAQAVDFAVTVCDFRDEFIEGWSMDDVELVKAFPDDIVREGFMGANAAIIALAHDPRVDDMALMEAFNGNAFYIAAMGSSQTSEKRRARLIELGVSSDQLTRLFAPAGIPTGSKTPWEIAISVVAQLTAERNRILQNKLS